MEAKKHRWWYAYGLFDEGENNLPHLGQVIRYYRELRKWKAKDLADALGQSVRHVYEMESNTNMPELISRRYAISKLLSIPPVLLGLSVVISDNPTEAPLVQSAGIIKAIDSQTMSLYENMLAASWQLYYTSSAQHAAININNCIQLLTNTAKNARGVERAQIISMLCRYYQLSGVAARDRMDMNQALRDGKKAVDLAFQLENPELISASLFRRAKTLMKLQKYNAAIQDLEAAIPYANRSRDPLKGYVYQATAEAYATLPKKDTMQQKQCFTMLDQVGRIIRKGELEDDGSFVKVNVAGLYMDRAQAYTQYGKHNEAHNALNIARNNLGPELTRWQARLLIADAQAYLAEGDPESSCEIALDALKVVKATQSSSNKARIQSLHRQMQSKYPRHPLVNRLGAQLQS
ncbi:hypothetical protein KSC_046160 [Ktedonobacter sp. SOSP1-52]|uniref:helix-turn-helix transcriptional regulator n=1 Tax=Ktedonobacter sp. SOSP1-52 TaxID=2778366 RepID=UPI001916516A|nr:helix-turn-helix transcriptional regulator [Ktedonobacter sp. SOSP1-52]GHO65724.1 hypothetical protein KSC_046160 [Ktedonobacter sp. SOSP1-52]